MNFFSGIEFWHAGHYLNYNVTHRHYCTLYGIQYNHAGRFRLRIEDGKEFQAEGAWAFITRPGALFEYGPCDGGRRDHYFICVRGPVIDKYLKSGLLPENDAEPLIKINHPDKFCQSMLNMDRMINSYKFSHDRMELMLADLLLQLHEQEHEEVRMPAYQVNNFSRLVQQIESEPELAWDFVSEAGKFDISISHFRRLFKQYCNLPPRLFLLNQRLRMATKLLVETTEPVNIIASQVGIDDVYYFSRAFKKRYTVSPTSYRKEYCR